MKHLNRLFNSNFLYETPNHLLVDFIYAGTVGWRIYYPGTFRDYDPIYTEYLNLTKGYVLFETFFPGKEEDLKYRWRSDGYFICFDDYIKKII